MSFKSSCERKFRSGWRCLFPAITSDTTSCHRRLHSDCSGNSIAQARHARCATPVYWSSGCLATKNGTILGKKAFERSVTGLSMLEAQYMARWRRHKHSPTWNGFGTCRLQPVLPLSRFARLSSFQLQSKKGSGREVKASNAVTAKRASGLQRSEPDSS